MHNPLRSPAVILFDSEKENAMLDQVLQPGVRPQKLATRNNAVSYRNTGRFLDADAVFSSDELAGGGPAAAYFLWSRPKISKQRKATATASPCGVPGAAAQPSGETQTRCAQTCGSLLPMLTPHHRRRRSGFYKRLAAQCAASGFGLIRFEPGQ